MPPSEHADWVLDLGPGGGVNGGEIVAEGTPEAVAANERSFTGQYLRGDAGESAGQFPGEGRVHAKKKPRRKRAPSDAISRICLRRIARSNQLLQ